MATQDDYTRITLRIPKDLHARLAQAAEETSKSMNAEIIARLEETFDIEEALDEVVKGGAPFAGTASLLLTMHAQLEKRAKDYRDSATTSHSEEIERHIHSTNSHLYTVEHQLQQIIELLTKK